MNLFKKIFMPTGALKTVDALRSWTVKWSSYRHGFGSFASLEYQAEVFVNEEDAKNFKNELTKAFKFTKSSITNITITENTQ